jgi:hypothetical protein
MNFINELLVQDSRDVRRGSAVKGRTPTFAAIAEQRELRNGKDLSADLCDRTVHFAGVVFKDPQLRNAPCENLCVVGRVFFFDTQEDEDAGADAGLFLSINSHASAGYPLNDSSHI